MRVETNERLARRNRQIAQYLFFFSFGVLILGLFVINQPAPAQGEDVTLSFLLSSAVLPFAFITTMLSVRMTNLWVRPPRPEVVIREGLKGISSKSVLYNYYHFPARHVLITPYGVFAIITRFQDGRFTVRGSKWISHRSPISRFFGIFRLDGIGNPTLDAQRAADHVKKLLANIAPDVPVQGVVVFVDPRAQLEIENPDVPVVHADSKREPSLKDYIRSVMKENRPTLTPEQIEAFEQATLPRR